MTWLRRWFSVLVIVATIPTAATGQTQTAAPDTARPGLAPELQLHVGPDGFFKFGGGVQWSMTRGALEPTLGLGLLLGPDIGAWWTTQVGMNMRMVGPLYIGAANESLWPFSPVAPVLRAGAVSDGGARIELAWFLVPEMLMVKAGIARW